MNAAPRHIDHARFFDELTRANRRLRALFDARAKGMGRGASPPVRRATSWASYWLRRGSDGSGRAAMRPRLT